MPPRIHACDDLKTDISEIESLNFLCKSIEEVKQTNASNEKKNDLLVAKDEKINQLEHRVDELEQHSRKRNVIVTLTLPPADRRRVQFNKMKVMISVNPQ